MEETKRFYGKIVCKIIFIAMISIFISAICAGIRGKNIKNCIKDLVYGHGQAMHEEVIEETEEQITEDEEGIYVNIPLFNDYVQKVELDFDQVLHDAVNIELFFTSAQEEEFSESKRILYQIKEGKENFTLDVGRKVCSLYINIEKAEGDSFSLKSIRVNENATPFSLKKVISVVYANFYSSIWYERVIIFSIIIFFIGVCIIFDRKKICSVMFQYRWFIAGVILVFLVINRYNGDSLTMYNLCVQQGEGNDYIETVIGTPRSVRSDEWVVSAPTSLSTQFLEEPYGKYNNIMRGTDTVNGRNMTFYSLVNPIYTIGILLENIFGYDYQYSFTWYAPIFLAFLLTIEFFLIITKGRKLLSFTGSCMLLLSSYYLWWGFPSWILYTHGAFVCMYYFFNTESFKKKIFFAYGTGLFAALFVLVLYPAWQVPVGYTALAVLIWMLHENWEKIKKLTKSDIVMMVLAFIFCAAIIISYIYAQREYTTSITQTVYPGKRVSTGGFSIDKLFNYCAALLFPFKDPANASESGTVINFFPIPMLMSAYLWWKSKKKNWLVSGLLMVGCFLTVYTTLGLPMIIAKLTLMTYSTAQRAVDILGYVQVLLFLLIFSEYDGVEKLPKKAAGIIAVLMSAVTIYGSNRNLNGYMGKLYPVVIAVVIVWIMFVILSRCSEKKNKQMFVTIIIVSLITGVYVRPIEKGTDAIYSKPLAKEIQKIVKQDSQSLWLAYGDGIVLQSFSISCGARTINSVNKYPNWELWKKLDPEGKYENNYNRYAHISLDFTEDDTSVDLIQEDYIQLNLSYKDIELTDAKYIVSTTKLSEEHEFVTFNEIYSEAGSYIYEIQYK
jgi:hypothetical protein